MICDEIEIIMLGGEILELLLIDPKLARESEHSRVIISRVWTEENVEECLI